MLNLNNLIIFSLKNFFAYCCLNIFFLKNIENVFYIVNFNENKFLINLKKAFFSFRFYNNFSFKSYFFLKFIKQFNILYSTTIYHNNFKIILSSCILKKRFYFINNFLYKQLIRFSNVIYYNTVHKNNFLTLDSSYLNSLPLYNYIYKNSNLNSFKNYFFVRPQYFTYKRWIYFYTNFCFKFNIELFILFDYKYFLNYLHEIGGLNKPLAALITLNSTDDFIDYPLFTKNNLHLNKLFYIILISQAYFLGLNYLNYSYKLKYINFFYNFSKFL